MLNKIIHFYFQINHFIALKLFHSVAVRAENPTRARYRYYSTKKYILRTMFVSKNNLDSYICRYLFAQRQNKKNALFKVFLNQKN